MSPPEDYLQPAVDESTPADERRAAIDGLEAANECDGLVEVARSDDLDREFREQAITSLAHPQCDQTLAALVDSGDLPEELQELAREQLAETSGDSGAGP